MTNEDLATRIEQEFERQKEAVSRPNLMVVGGTGVGKSSLINTVFGAKVAETGSGTPVTRGCVRYEQPEIPVAIYDTEGYEIIEGGQEDPSNFQTVVLAKVRELQQQPIDAQIHLVWYCISVGGHKITDYDLKNIQELLQIRGGNGTASRMKLAVVLTQCDTDSLNKDNQGEGSLAIRSILADSGITVPVFETSCDPEFPLDLTDLIEWSSQALPDESYREGFIAAQRYSLQKKRTAAYATLAGFTATAAGIGGANPLPLSDAALLIPLQMGMASRLAALYGFTSFGEQVMALLKTQLLTVVGKSMAASITKFIPVAGQVINAGVAASLTGGMGYALIEIYTRAYNEMLKTGRMPDWTKYLSMKSILSAFEQGKEAWENQNV